jgi:Zn-finger nucleic acid-binding protein
MTGLGLEPRYPCPVCLGATMKKVRLTERERDLVLDYCPRCGGMWFELGEVQLLRKHSQDSLWSRVERRTQDFRVPCHSCQAIIDRNAPECDVCGWKNLLQCPSCDRPLALMVHDGLRLDVCNECRGVWFDHIELSAIWNASLKPTQAIRRKETVSSSEVGLGVAEVLVYSPGLLFYGAQGAGMVIQGAASTLGNAPEAIGTAVEVVGDAAGGVFEAIAEIIGGIFS